MRPHMTKAEFISIDLIMEVMVHSEHAKLIYVRAMAWNSIFFSRN